MSVVTPPAIKEEIHYEGGPARGDLIINLIFGVTLIGLPFAVGAVVRAQCSNGGVERSCTLWSKGSID